MEPFEIKIDGKQFEKYYLIYVIIINHNEKGKYYYVGQTGDRCYKTARPAFRRLAGHFSDIGQSTENQVYRQIIEKILKKNIEKNMKFEDKIKNSVTKFLIDCEIKMKVFPIIKYESSISEKKHKENTMYVENIEKIVIKSLCSTINTERLLNKKRIEPIKLKDTDEKANEIIKIITNEIL